MAVEDRVRNLIFLTGILIISISIILYELPIIFLIPALLTISIYILGINLKKVSESIFISSLIMMYMVLEGVQIYHVGVLFTLLALIYEPRRSHYEHRIVYLVIGVSILMATYISMLYEYIGLPGLYRSIYLVWGGMLVITWIYIFSSPRTSRFFDMTMFGVYYQRLVAKIKTIGIVIIYLILIGASIPGDFLLGILIPIIGLYLIYRRISSIHLAGLLILLYFMLSIFYGVDKAFIELDGLIRSVGGWFG